jgi:hypothetical protein
LVHFLEISFKYYPIFVGPYFNFGIGEKLLAMLPPQLNIVGMPIDIYLKLSDLADRKIRGDLIH